METNNELIKPREFECMFPAYDACNYCPEAFDEILGNEVAKSLIECESEEEMIAFNENLKKELVKWIDCNSYEPLNHHVENDSIAPYVEVALNMIAGQEEFRQSEEFVDSILNYVSNISPFLLNDAKNCVDLVNKDVSAEANNKMQAHFNNLGQKRKIDWLTEHQVLCRVFERPEDDIDRLFKIGGLNNIFPNEELFSASQDYAKQLMAKVVEEMYWGPWGIPTIDNLRISYNQQANVNLLRLNPIHIAKVMNLESYLAENCDSWVLKLRREYEEIEAESDGVDEDESDYVSPTEEDEHYECEVATEQGLDDYFRTIDRSHWN